MSEQEHKIKKILRSRLTLFLLLLGFLWLALSLVNVYYKKYKIAKEIDDLKQEIAKTEKGNQEISAMIDYLGSQDFLEIQAREKLNMKKEGEQVVIVEPPKELDADAQEFVPIDSFLDSQSGPAENPSHQDSNFEKWWKYFFR